MSAASRSYVALGGLGALVVVVGTFLAREPFDEKVQIVGWLLITIALINGVIGPRLR